jgi:hypothetical protein
VGVEVGERAEGELYNIVEKRAREAEGDPKEEAVWAEFERKARARRERQNRDEWQRFHYHMSALHLALSQEHAQKAERLEESG